MKTLARFPFNRMFRPVSFAVVTCSVQIFASGLEPALKVAFDFESCYSFETDKQLPPPASDPDKVFAVDHSLVQDTGSMNAIASKTATSVKVQALNQLRIVTGSEAEFGSPARKEPEPGRKAVIFEGALVETFWKKNIELGRKTNRSDRSEGDNLVRDPMTNEPRGFSLFRIRF